MGDSRSGVGLPPLDRSFDFHPTCFLSNFSTIGSHTTLHSKRKIEIGRWRKSTLQPKNCA